MQTVSVPALPVSTAPRMRTRTAVLASTDRSFRQRLGQTLRGLRWTVREAETGAQAWEEAEACSPEALIVDAWLPDLDVAEFVNEFQTTFPRVDLLTTEGCAAGTGMRSPYRQELLHALRTCQDADQPVVADRDGLANAASAGTQAEAANDSRVAAALNAKTDCAKTDCSLTDVPTPALTARMAAAVTGETACSERLPELIGNAPAMLDVCRRIRLVGPRSTPVLIEGPTGSGKELVAEALHRLSTRSRKPFVAINCAAIPEALLEAELFGHTRGAFTGAVQGRVGRIESADGGTLFLDEIGEMPLALQAKLLRFVESGELQRVGENEPVRVNVRIIAATHRPLARHAHEGAFRADLYYRLAVFLIRTPALSEHGEDLPLLVDHFMKRMGREEPIKHIDASAMLKLTLHPWPGNVRELEHVLERAAILAGGSTRISANEIDFGLSIN